MARLGAFLDAFVRVHRPRGRRVALLGVSNGGIAAFALATEFPERVSSVTVAPGYAPAGVELARATGVPFTLLVGARDRWRGPVQATGRRLDAAGIPHQIQVLPGAGHVLASELSWPQLRATLRVPAGGT